MGNQFILPSRRTTTTIHDLPGDLLELTLLRMPSTAGVIRAAATCKLWRRVIGDAGFLRRFRRLNGPNILGHYRYYDEDGRTDFFPFPAPAAKEIASIDDIGDRASLDFLPTIWFYHSYELMHPVLHDSRHGLLTFYQRIGSSIIVRCPWTRQHRELYLTQLTQPWRDAYTSILGIFLLDALPDETGPGPGLNMSNFRVLCVRLIHYCSPYDIKTVDASVFSARDDSWLQMGTMAANDIIPGTIFPYSLVLVLLGRATGSICWYSESTNAVLHLDESTSEFSSFTLPGHVGINTCYNRSNLRVIAGDTSSVRLVRISGDDLELLCYDRGFGACVVERRVRASQVDSIDVGFGACVEETSASQVGSIDEEVRQYWYRRWYFSGSADEAAVPGCVVLCDNKCDIEYVWMFSVDTQDIELQRVQKLNRHGGQAFPYELPWTISVCL
ncbi:unnamed protein product [Urochloa humidicola]